MVVCLFLITSNLFSYEAVVYHDNENQFSVDGYDFFKNGEFLPIVLGKSYDIVEDGEVILAGDSYKKLIRITDPITGQSDVFTTRVINNTKKAMVKEATETKRISGERWGALAGDDYACYYRFFELDYEITLEDGETLKFSQNQVEYLHQNGINPNALQILPGDQIEILAEKPHYSLGNFAATHFEVKITRNEELIGFFGVSVFDIKRRDSIIGTRRQDKAPHQSNSGKFVLVKEYDSSSNSVTFDNIEGEWERVSNWFERVYASQPLLFVDQINDNEIILSPLHTDLNLVFRRKN